MMKELITHNKNGGELISIKSIGDNYSDRQYLNHLISHFASLSNGHISIEASRPNYSTTQIIEHLKKSTTYNNNLQFDTFELSFSCTEVYKGLSDILSMIWFAYEHPVFCFFAGDSICFNTKRTPWYEITSDSKSFVMFKGAEDDVVWIGKSDKLKFNLKESSLF